MPALDLSASTVELTRQLVDIESVSGNETALADAVEVALAPLAHLEVTRDGDAIVARTQLGRDRRVVIAGHLDTVPVNDNLPSRLDDGRRHPVGSWHGGHEGRLRDPAEARRRARRTRAST